MYRFCRSTLFPFSLFRAAALFFLAGSLAPTAHADKKNIVPDWMRDAAAHAPTDFPETADIAYLLRDTTYTVSPDMHAVEHVREVIKILRPQGRQFAEMGTYYDSLSKIRSMHIWSLGADGHEYEVKDNEFAEVGAGGGADFYSDDRFRYAKAPAAEPGAVIAMEYTQEMRPYRNEYDWFAQTRYPVVSERLRLELPPGAEYKSSWKGENPAKPVDLEHGAYLWELHNEPGIDLRHTPLAPSRRGLESRLSIHYFTPGMTHASRGDWQSTGEWYQFLADGKNAASPEIAAKAQELVSGKSDFADRAQAIGEFVQSQVRYVAIEIGVGGYQPHAAADIYKHRYGDCKDKATLLSAMLSAVGIHSTWVLVDTARGYVDPGIPSSSGNHAIAAIELPAGYTSPRLKSVVATKSGKHFLIFDPTWEYTPFGQLEHEQQGSYGLLVDGASSELVAFPVLDPSSSRIDRKGIFHLAEDGTLTGDITTETYGDDADSLRTIFRLTDEKKQHEAIEHWLGQDLPNVSYTGLKVANEQVLTKDMELKLSLTSGTYARKVGNLLMFRPRVIGQDNLAFDREPRKWPINLNQVHSFNDSYEIELPAGYAVDELPDPVKLDLGFASYESSTKVEGNKLHFERHFTVRQVTLPATQYADIRKLGTAIGNDERNNAVLKKTATN